MKKWIGLIFCLSVLIPAQSKARSWPANAADSLELDGFCTDSLGRKTVCDSAWLYVNRGTTVIDSGRTTTFPATIGTTRIYLRPGRESTYVAKTVGQTTVGAYRLTLQLWGGTDDGKRLDMIFHDGYEVGALTTTDWLAAADVKEWLNTAAATPTVAGVPEVDVTHFVGTLAPAPTVTGVPKVDPNTWDGTDITTGVPLAPTTAGRTLDVTATGAAGVDWANVEGQGSTVGLTGTQVHVYDTDTSGAVDVVVSAIGAGAISATSFSGNAITAGVIAADAITSSELATSAAQEIATWSADSVWESAFEDRNDVAGSWGITATTNVNTLGWAQTGAASGVDSAGLSRAIRRMFGLQNAASQADSLTIDDRTVHLQRWDDADVATALPGGTLANTTNITAGTITTTTNVTNPVTTTTADKQAGATIYADSLAQLVNQDPDNLIHDPGFEGRALGNVWFDVAGSSIVTNGSIKLGRKVLRVAGAGQAVSDTFRVLQGQRIHFGMDVLAPASPTNVQLAIQTAAGTDIKVIVGGALVASKWLKVEDYWKFAATGTYRVSLLSGPTSAESIRVDNVFVNLAPDSATPAAPGASGADSGTVARIGKRMWGIALGASGSDSTTVLQRTVAAHGTGGAGAFLCSLLVIDSAAGTPVQGVITWITTSGAFTAGSLTSNSAGNVVFNLDNGTHAAHIFKSLTRLAANADTVINISGANFKDTITVVSPAIPASPIAGQVTIAGNLYDISADEAEGAVVTFYLNEMSFYSIDDTTNMVAVAGEKTVTVDSTGYWQVNIYPTTKLVSSDRRNPPKYAITIQWPGGNTKCTEYEWTFDTACCQALQWQLHRWKANCSR